MADAQQWCAALASAAPVLARSMSTSSRSGIRATFENGSHGEEIASLNDVSASMHAGQAPPPRANGHRDQSTVNDTSHEREATRANGTHPSTNVFDGFPSAAQADLHATEDDAPYPSTHSSGAGPDGEQLSSKLLAIEHTSEADTSARPDGGSMHSSSENQDTFDAVPVSFRPMPAAQLAGFDPKRQSYVAELEEDESLARQLAESELVGPDARNVDATSADRSDDLNDHALSVEHSGNTMVTTASPAAAASVPVRIASPDPARSLGDDLPAVPQSTPPMLSLVEPTEATASAPLAAPAPPSVPSPSLPASTAGLMDPPAVRPSAVVDGNVPVPAEGSGSSPAATPPGRRSATVGASSRLLPASPKAHAAHSGPVTQLSSEPVRSGQAVADASDATARADASDATARRRGTAERTRIMMEERARRRSTLGRERPSVLESRSNDASPLPAGPSLPAEPPTPVVESVASEELDESTRQLQAELEAMRQRRERTMKSRTKAPSPEPVLQPVLQPVDEYVVMDSDVLGGPTTSDATISHNTSMSGLKGHAIIEESEASVSAHTGDATHASLSRMEPTPRSQPSVTSATGTAQDAAGETFVGMQRSAGHRARIAQRATSDGALRRMSLAR
jgi:hypothetical protein